MDGSARPDLMRREAARDSLSWAVVPALVLMAGAALCGALYVYQELGVDRAEQRKLLAEAGKILMQLAAIGVVGAVVKTMLDSMLDDRRRRAKQEDETRERRHARSEWLADFRADKLRRLVAATNTVRRARVLIPAHGSAKTYGEQMRELQQVGLEIGLIRHEIHALGAGEDNPAFPGWPALRDLLHRLERYLHDLVLEFLKEYEARAELQVKAEKARTDAERAALREQIRREILGLPGVTGLLAEGSGPELEGITFLGDYHEPYRQAVDKMVVAMARDRLRDPERADGSVHAGAPAA
ncbi:hypothetical protein [Falsiroseomonas oryzae]|uniref:hypothetical protein n=1 Tax=Falsiroseomonas oryzae TaxID=2766473 RepID=UPI0022EAD41A|nr:hypothetical protein [Roseomonas sp. MO-31]